MKSKFLFLLALLGYLSVLAPLTRQMQNRSDTAKVGYAPHPAVLKAISTDQKVLSSALLIFKAITHGNLSQPHQTANATAKSFQDNTFKTLYTATRLDPYNMDAYYLAQAMVWNKSNTSQICELLEFGMQHRTWDFYLPFFAGFNYSYFLQDYTNAAKNYKKAAALTNSPLLARLTGRYLYEGGQTDMAITYIKTMLKSAHQPAIKKTYSMRLKVLQEIQRIETSIKDFSSLYGKKPSNIKELLSTGNLLKPPVDPYGGVFYLDDNGKPRTTSKMANPSQTK